MVRALSEKDFVILIRAAPEFKGESCSSSGVSYRSILPPVANHYSSDCIDFKSRISTLSDDELIYLFSLIEDGSESLHCLNPEYADALISVIRTRLGDVEAKRVGRIYAAQVECD